MAVVLQTLVDSDFEHVVKLTTSSTNSTASIVDASGLAGAATDPRLSLVAARWSVEATTDIIWNATSNIIALSLNGNGAYGGSDGMPSIANNGGSGVDGDVLITNGASDGYAVLKFRKVSGYDNIT
tara:strand:- start:74 stop:451 length:378 start_codon:yes stop_codon:yes gene_type:complete